VNEYKHGVNLEYAAFYKAFLNIGLLFMELVIL